MHFVIFKEDHAHQARAPKLTFQSKPWMHITNTGPNIVYRHWNGLMRLQRMRRPGRRSWHVPAAFSTLLSQSVKGLVKTSPCSPTSLNQRAMKQQTCGMPRLRITDLISQVSRVTLGISRRWFGRTVKNWEWVEPRLLTVVWRLLWEGTSLQETCWITFRRTFSKGELNKKLN